MDKGKQRAVDPEIDENEDSDLEIYPEEYLEGLLNKARAAYEVSGPVSSEKDAEDVLMLEKEDSETPLPTLDAKRLLPKPYLQRSTGKNAQSVLDTESLLADSISASATLPPPPQPHPTKKDGTLMTHKEIKELKRKEKGPGYFDLPTPDAAEATRIQRDMEALKLRNALDPKRFYRKETLKTGKRAELPKQIAIGTIITTKTPFGTTSGENLTRSERKRSVLDELLADSEARSYAKRKYEDLHSVRKERGRDTLNKKRLARRAKW